MFDKFLAPKYNNSEVGKIQEERAAKHHYKKVRRYTIYFFSIAIASMISLAATFDGNNMYIESEAFFILPMVVDLIKGEYSLDKYSFNLYIYLPFILTLMLAWYLLIMDKKRYSKETTVSKIKNKIGSILFTPLNALFFTNDRMKYLKVSASWLSKIEYELLYQHISKSDGYARVRKLNYLHKLNDLYTKEEYKHLCLMFRNEESLIDLYKITEGYLVGGNIEQIGPKGEKYKVPNCELGEKFDEIVKLNKKNYNNFKAFNGKDKVYFSTDYIVLKTLEESEKFKLFIEKRMFSKLTTMGKEINRFYNLFKKDDRALAMLLGVNNNDIKERENKNNKKILEKIKSEIALEEQRIINLKYYFDSDEVKENPAIKDEILKNLIVEKFTLYFKFIFSRILLQRYVNIPAGTVVVKINEYTLRLIVDTYISKTIINLERNVNDGGSSSFENDSLANMFLYSFNMYLYGRKEKVMDEVEKTLNTDLINSRVEQEEIEKFQGFIEEISKSDSYDNFKEKNIDEAKDAFDEKLEKNTLKEN